jgi:hypothetical protein
MLQANYTLEKTYENVSICPNSFEEHEDKKINVATPHFLVTNEELHSKQCKNNFIVFKFLSEAEVLTRYSKVIKTAR